LSTVTISIPDNLKLYVEEQVKTKGYGNVSEYFRSLVREARQREADQRLESLLLEGLESESIPITPEFLKELRSEAALRVAEARKRYNDAGG
jgi:antitoxin ParD1/3/4